MMPNASAPIPITDSRLPTGSRFESSGSKVSGTNSTVMTAMTKHSTAVPAKIEPNQNDSIRAPAPRAPSVPPTAALTVHAATAWERRSDGMTLVIVERVPGKIMAEKAPPRKRLAISIEMSVVDDAHTNDPIRPTNPISMSRLRPKRSPRAPAGSNSAASAIA